MMKVEAFLMSCPERAQVRAATHASFAQTDWHGAVVQVIDDGTSGDRVRGITANWQRLIVQALASNADFFLLMEDDLEFNLYLEHNLRCWAPLRCLSGQRAFFGSLYNPARSYLLKDDARQYFLANPGDFWGTQAIVVSRATAGYILRFWDPNDAADILISRLGAQVGPLYQHSPSLVQHAGNVSTWGGIYHTANDYDRNFRAPGSAEACIPTASVIW